LNISIEEGLRFFSEVLLFIPDVDEEKDSNIPYILRQNATCKNVKKLEKSG